jgi:death on curing protein
VTKDCWIPRWLGRATYLCLIRASPSLNYGFGMGKNHAFVDGNKPIAFIATAMFLRMNGLRLVTERVDEIQTMQSLARGEINGTRVCRTDPHELQEIYRAT